MNIFLYAFNHCSILLLGEDKVLEILLRLLEHCTNDLEANTSVETLELPCRLDSHPNKREADKSHQRFVEHIGCSLSHRSDT